MYVIRKTPLGNINEKASEVNKLTNKGKQLYHNNQPVTSWPRRVVAGKILEFLQSLKKNCILIGHNSKRYDIPLLILFMYQSNLLYEFCDIVDGFTDSLILMEKKFPERKNEGKLKLTTLVRELLQTSFENAHDAMGDVCALECLMHAYFNDDYLISSKYTITESVINLQKSLNQKMNVASFAPLRKSLSCYMIDKIYSFGITLDTLK